MLTGQNFGPYQVLELLGEGAMGQVFRGYDLALNREVAIKVIRPEISQSTDLLDRFKNEATLLARVNHGNICSVYAFVEHNQQYAIVLQYLEGKLLQEFLNADKKLTLHESVKVIREVLHGLIEAHRHDIIHRDLKPANLMLTPIGRVVIMDFGIAKTKNQQRVTRAGMMIGTVEYASPEQIRGEEVDARSDLYSLGLIAFEMLSGCSPFNAKTDFEWMKAQTQEEIDVQFIQKNFGSDVAHFIKCATEKDPKKRFHNAQAMLDSLNEIKLTNLSSTHSEKKRNIPGFLINHASNTNAFLVISGLLSIASASFFLLDFLRNNGNQNPAVEVVDINPTLPPTQNKEKNSAIQIALPSASSLIEKTDVTKETKELIAQEKRREGKKHETTQAKRPPSKLDWNARPGIKD